MTGPADAAPRGAHRPDRVGQLLRSMSLEEKVGQLFVTYAYGTTADTTDPAAVAQNRELYGVDNGAQLVAKYHLGGVIYFTWANTLTDPATIATLSNGLQRAATTSGAKVPLLTTIDQEGGRVVRIGAPAAVSPGNMTLGASFDPRLTYSAYRANAEQLRALGINVDDAPVVDTNTNPANAADGSRAFGDTPLQTAVFGAAAVRGLESRDVAAVAKHFPGLGSTEVNTDFGEAVSDQTRAEFERYDLPAFRAAVAAGTDQIMAAHIVAPALDPTGAPASLSKPMVTGILRDKLHYDGLVVTDALSAEALHDYTNTQRVVGALQAGVDQLLMPTDLADGIDAVLAAVRSGEISTQRIDESVRRVLTAKQKLGLFDANQVDVAKAAASVGTVAQHRTMATAARRGVTLYRNSAGTLPLAANPGTKVLVTGYGATTSTTLTADLQAKGVQATRVYTGSAPSDAAIAAAVTAAKDADYAVVISNDAWGDAQQRALAAQVRATGTPTIVLAVGAPYELGYAPETPTFLATFGYQADSLQAATDVLFGAQPSGRSPVTVRTPDGTSVVAKLGSGLRYHR
ncbi:glycoside hydrolase family 3 protein [Jatrophihabitans endophyticus]|nr:glycoside hydrolase family 3 protein [Jatrophihabitans endophyticus]